MTDNISSDADPDAALELPREATPSPAPSTAPQGPRIRLAGVVWGLVLVAIAVTGVYLTTRPNAVDILTSAVQNTPPAAAIGYAVIGLGALLLVTGLVGLLRRAQARH